MGGHAGDGAWPDRAALVERLRALIAGADRPGIRDEIGTWAEREMLANDDVRVTDDAAWDVLVAMTGADTPTIDREYLYGPVDFEAWLNELT
jgi:hypothetical protein